MAPESMDMMPPTYQQPAHFPQMRHHTPSASPPIPNGSFANHHHPQRGHTPQPSVGSRPVSRNDGRRMGPGMVPHGGHPGVPYMPTPPIYNPNHAQPPMVSQPGPQYSYSAPAPPPPPQLQQPHPQAQPPPAQPYMDERRVSAPPPPYASQTSHPMPAVSRTEPSPPQHTHHHAQSIPQISTTPPQSERREPQPPPPVEPKSEHPMERAQPPLLNTDTAIIKKLPQRKSHSIFTPIEEDRSILSRHLASFASDAHAVKVESSLSNASRPHSVDVTSSARNISSPPRPGDYDQKSRTVSVSSAERNFTPPSRSNSFKTGAAAAGAARPRGPRLTVQIPDGGSDPGSATGGDSISPRPVDTTTQAPPHRQNSVILPPPSPSTSALLSAGASGPPNPFARPPPQSHVETPASALPSRFLGTEFLPSPSSFYNDWNFRATSDNTLPSPLNFSTPIASTGPSFLREDFAASASTTAATVSSKRKSPESGDHTSVEGPDLSSEAKRVKVE